MAESTPSCWKIGAEAMSAYQGKSYLW
jgi:hypothetical protein